MKHSESFSIMTSNKRQEVVYVRLREAKVRFSHILDYPVHCITFAKERKKGKRQLWDPVFLLPRAYELCLACQHFISKWLIGHLPCE